MVFTRSQVRLLDPPPERRMTKLPRLVLDDEKYRLEAFEARFGKNGTVYVKDAWSAKKSIEDTFKFDEMYLDHDLGPGGDGRDVIDVIVALPDDRVPNYVYVHSMNNVAGMQMIRMLKDRGIPCIYAPFHTLGLL